MLKDKKSHTLDIQDRDIPLFYERVLQKILPYAELTVRDVNLESYRPKELKAQFSFDSTGPDEITMKPLLSYGDFSFSPLNDDKVPRIICRDVPGEFKISQVIRKYFKYRDPKDGRLVLKEDEKALYHLLDKGMEEFRSMGDVYLSESMKNWKIMETPTVSAGVSAYTGWLELTVDMGEFPKGGTGPYPGCLQPEKEVLPLKERTIFNAG